MSDKASLLFEIGVEELPASYVDKALSVLPDLFRQRLQALRLSHVSISAMGTPRRLAVFVDGLLLRQPDLSEKVQGPPARVAFDKQGNATKAALAFASKIGCSVGELGIEETAKGAYVVGTRVEVGRATADLLGPVLAEICGAIPFRKSMRWSDVDTAFGRPVRWIVALLGGQVVDMEFAGVRSGRMSLGHRFLSPGSVSIGGDLSESAAPIELACSRYVGDLSRAHVVVRAEMRREMISDGLRKICGEMGATLVEDEELLAENVNLVEEPFLVVGSFDEAFLALPDEVIIAVAKGHQKCFCARGSDGKLVPAYFGVAGTFAGLGSTVASESGYGEGAGAGVWDADGKREITRVGADSVIRVGNDRVMKARLSDARFFYEEDLKVALESRYEQLGGIVFQRRLGTVRDKVERVVSLVGLLADMINLDEESKAVALRGARLCKCDLVSLMVGEFPELQGVMGAAYALVQGELEGVSKVISMHYQPKGASDSTADFASAAVVAIADRLDTLVGCFSVGLAPTGAADPYALRRACIGVLRTVWDRGYEVSVGAMLDAAYCGFGGVGLDLSKDELRVKLGAYFEDRMRFGLVQDGYPQDVVDACLASGCDVPTDVLLRVRALSGLTADVRSRAGEVFKRATNIARESPCGEVVDPICLDKSSHEAEKAAYHGLLELRGKLRCAHGTRDYPAVFAAIAAYAPVLGEFFTHVLVMDEDMVLRENRLRLMRSVSEQCSGVAHFNMLT